MHAKNLDAYLDQADGINSLIPQAKRLIELRHILLEALPGSLAGRATLANYRQGKVVIFAANAAIAAKLKLLGPTITDCFARRGLQVTALNIEVQPGRAPCQQPEKHAVLTSAARESLAGLSKQLPDSELKNRITALADRKS